MHLTVKKFLIIAAVVFFVFEGNLFVKKVASNPKLYLMKIIR